MVFSSLVFLFVFLIVHLAVYFKVDPAYRNAVLLVSSLIFYAWAGPQFVLLIMFETLASWVFAILIARSSTLGQRRLFMVGECVVLLGLLGYFKYTGFFLSNLQAIFGVPSVIPDILLPIGISFYSFQLISYVADVYTERVEAQPSYWKLLMYASLFHQCIAGPIIRYETVAAEIEERSITSSDVYYGVRRFCIGLAKKAILANSCAAVADSLIPVGGELGGQAVLVYWIGMLFYAFQIYFDFSGYSDMAIGLGRMVGFHYLENFNYPYMAKSVKDFWTRWHISLSSFFRDYVYIPLGGSRVEEWKIVRNYAIVWSLTGFWHGASWNYVLWGVYFLAFLMLERYVIKDKMPKGAGHVYAIVVLLISWVLFRYESSAEMFTVLGGMIGIGASGFAGLAVTTVLKQNLFLMIGCVIACTPLSKMTHEKMLELASENDLILTVYNVLEAITPPLLLILAIIALAGASYNPFIYFQF